MEALDHACPQVTSYAGVVATTQAASGSRTRSPGTATVRSSVALKALMAISGLIMVLFLLAHMYGNLKVFAGPAAFDDYSHHLRTLGEPFLPYAGFLWILRAVLTVSVIAHFVSALSLWTRAHRARGGTRRYQSSKARRGVQRTYASFTLRWGGIVILLFVIFHILNLSTGTIHPGGVTGSPYGRLTNSFHNVPVLIAYVVSMLSVGLHLRHGVWSALTTLGANHGERSRRNLNILSIGITVVVTVGFLLVPFSVVAGVVR